MSAEAVVVAALLASSEVKTAVGNGDSPETYRISPLANTQDDGTMRITYQGVSLVPSASLDGNTGNLDQQRVQVDYWGRDYDLLAALAAAGRAAVASVPTSLLIGGFDDFDEISKTYRISQDYNIWARPA